ncbi:MAG: HlyD family efflux transporter periplasmic adaptor subunit, partial [Planctomycetota bacterium]
ARQQEKIEIADIAAFVRQMRRMKVVEETLEGKNRLIMEKSRQRRAERRFAGGAGSLFFMRFKLFDPDRLLNFLVKPLGFLYTKTFVMFAACLISTAAVILVTRWSDIAVHFKNIGMISSGAGISLASMWGTALAVVCIHELGHGLTCKYYGGEVHEMGFLLLFFQPCFYCNVNDAWTFESRSARLWVTAAGGFIETVIGSACVIIWALTQPGAWLHGVCYVVFMISLGSTLLFNMNPLIKLDGYYLLADWVGIDNFRDRTFTHIRWLLRGWLLGLPAPKATEDPREARIFTIYGCLSILYMTALIITLLKVIQAAMFGTSGPGPFMVVVMGGLLYMLLKRPLVIVGGAMSEVIKSNQAMLRSRGFWMKVGGGFAGVIALSFFIPWNVGAVAPGVVEPSRAMDITSPLGGRIVEVLVRDGETVSEGTPVIRLESPREVAVARMERETATRLRRTAFRLRARGAAADAAVKEKEAEAAEGRASDLEERLERRELVAPLDGFVLDHRVRDLVGLPVNREQRLLGVGDCSRVRCSVLMNARDSGPIRPGMKAIVRLEARPGLELEGEVISISGDVVVEDEDNPDPEAVNAVQWRVVVEAPNPDGIALPGMTGEVEVVFERTSLARAFAIAVGRTLRTDLL